MGKSKSKGSKNNPDNKVKQKQYKVQSIVECDKFCKNKCDKYYKYYEKLKAGKILKGITCKK